MTSARRVLGSWLVVGGIAVVVVAVLMAPAITVTSYGDAPQGSVTLEEQRSIVGFETSLWPWLLATLVTLVAVALMALGSRRLDRWT